MEKKKIMKISLGTAICIIIIVILICVIFGMWYYYNKTEKTNENVEQYNKIEKTNENVEQYNKTKKTNENVEKYNNKDAIEETQTTNNKTYNHEDEIKSVYDGISKMEYTHNWKDDENGRIAILNIGKEEFLRNKTEEGYYIYTDAFSNNYKIKTITDIISEFYLTNKDETVMLYKCQIKYITPENDKESFYSAVIVPINTTIGEPKIFAPFDKYTGSTAFVKTFGIDEDAPGM